MQVKPQVSVSSEGWGEEWGTLTRREEEEGMEVQG